MSFSATSIKADVSHSLLVKAFKRVLTKCHKSQRVYPKTTPSITQRNCSPVSHSNCRARRRAGDDLGSFCSHRSSALSTVNSSRNQRFLESEPQFSELWECCWDKYLHMMRGTNEVIQKMITFRLALLKVFLQASESHTNLWKPSST